MYNSNLRVKAAWGHRHTHLLPSAAGPSGWDRSHRMLRAMNLCPIPLAKPTPSQVPTAISTDSLPWWAISEDCVQMVGAGEAPGGDLRNRGRGTVSILGG